MSKKMVCGVRYTCPTCGHRMHAEDFIAAGEGPCKRCRAYTRAKNGAKARGIGFKLKKDEFLDYFGLSISRRCYYCGIQEAGLYEIGMKSPSGKQIETLGLDRVDSSRGYEFGNIVVCCFRCNTIKGAHRSLLEMVAIGFDIHCSLRDKGLIGIPYPPPYTFPEDY